MDPQPRLAIVGSIQQAISTMLTTYEPEFLRFGYSMFVAFATILIVWQGIKMMLTGESLGDHMFEFAKLLLFVSFGYALIAFYESSIPANLLYWLLLIVVTLAKVVALAIVAFGLIASAVCALLGPIFVTFFIVPKLDWLFWSWFKSFVQYSFVPVIAFAFLMIFERFIFQYLTTLPSGITEDYYLVYGLQALVIIGVFAAGILLVPTLTTSIFSGRGGGSVLPERLS